MKRCLILLVLAACAMSASVVHTSLYAWNETRRPPVSLAEALDKAKELLGDEAADRYCVRVSLYGDETGSGKEGAWNLFFAAKDGSKKQVVIDMQGHTHVRVWNGPINPNARKGLRTGMDHARREIEAVLGREGIEGKVSGDAEELIVEHRTRAFRIYPEQEDGSYGDELQEVPGPTRDGFWLRITIVDQPDLRNYGYCDGPYWRSYRGTFFTSQPGKYLALDLRYGVSVLDLGNELIGALGERTPDGWGG